MQKVPYTHPAFITAFANTCYTKGYTDKQAGSLLDTYIKADLIQNNQVFRDSMVKELEKSAMSTPKMLGASLGSAALAGLGVGAGTELGKLPNTTTGGATIGAGAGASLGAVGGLLKALATKGRSGIPGALNAPAKQLFGSAFRGVGIPMVGGALKGGLLGGIFGGAVGTAQAAKGESAYPDLLKSTGRPPWAANGASAPTPGTGNAVAANPFGLPSDILNEVNGYGKGNNTISVGAPGTPQAAVQNYKEQLTQLDQQINQLESSIPTASNPSTYAQRMQAQPQIDMLKRQRSSIANNISMLENQVGADKGRMAEFSTQQGALANHGLNTAQGEYRNLQDRLGSNSWLMKLYNQLSGAESQMQKLQPRYDYYNNAVQDAQAVGNLAK